MKVRGPGHSLPELHTAPRSPGTGLGMCTTERQEADSLQGYFRGSSSKSVLPESSSVPRKNLPSRVKACQPASQQCVHLSLPKGTHTSEQSPRGLLEEPLPCHCWLCLPRHAPSSKLKPWKIGVNNLKGRDSHQQPRVSLLPFSQFSTNVSLLCAQSPWSHRSLTATQCRMGPIVPCFPAQRVSKCLQVITGAERANRCLLPKKTLPDSAGKGNAHLPTHSLTLTDRHNCLRWGKSVSPVLT